MYLATGRPLPIGIVKLTCVQLAPIIHQRIARTTIKTDHRCAKHADVGDATDIEHADALAMCITRITQASKHLLMECGHQRRALAARCDVTAAKICDDGDAGQLRQQGRVVELQGVACGIKLTGAVPHRLPMRTHGLNLCGHRLGLRQKQLDHLRIHADQGIGCQGGKMQFVVTRTVECQQIGF